MPPNYPLFESLPVNDDTRLRTSFNVLSFIAKRAKTYTINPIPDTQVSVKSPFTKTYEDTKFICSASFIA